MYKVIPKGISPIMTINTDTLPSTSRIDTSDNTDLVTVATMRGVTTRRRLDRFWQMIRDESDVMYSYESGTYNIGDELDLKLVVIDIKKPASSGPLNDTDIHIFEKYRFNMKVVEGDPLDLGGMGIATPYNYTPPKPKEPYDGNGFS